MDDLQLISSKLQLLKTLLDALDYTTDFTSDEVIEAIIKSLFVDLKIEYPQGAQGPKAS